MRLFYFYTKKSFLSIDARYTFWERARYWLINKLLPTSGDICLWDTDSVRGDDLFRDEQDRAAIWQAEQERQEREALLQDNH